MFCLIFLKHSSVWWWTVRASKRECGKSNGKMTAVGPGERRDVWSKQNWWCRYSLPWHMLPDFVNLGQIFSPLGGDCSVIILLSVHVLLVFRNCSFICPLWIFAKDRMQLSDSPVPYYTWLKPLCLLFQKGHVKKKHVFFVFVLGRHYEFHGVRTPQNMIANTWC